MGVSFDDDRHYYMITEYASRGSIFDLLHSGRKVNVDDYLIFKIAKQMALAIRYLHTKKILHCDLKS